tara:strand:- start:234 stop:500 length:267 start_codon:yes stop_codon:yes gene_type:complete
MVRAIAVDVNQAMNVVMELTTAHVQMHVLVNVKDQTDVVVCKTPTVPETIFVVEQTRNVLTVTAAVAADVMMIISAVKDIVVVMAFAE